MPGVKNQRVSKGFLQEIYDKEVRIRLNFASKHKEIVRTTALFRGEPKNYERAHIDRAQAVAQLDILKRNQVSSAVHRKIKSPAPTHSDLTLNFTRKEEHFKPTKNVEYAVDEPIKSKEAKYAQAVADLANMKLDRVPARRKMKAPVDYNGGTANDKRKGNQVMRPIDEPTKELITEGTKEYFKKRYQMKPEDKYYYPQSTNWQYGWKLQDSLIKMHGPAHGRVNLLGAKAYPKVGFHPDPWFYGNSRQQGGLRRFDC